MELVCLFLTGVCWIIVSEHVHPHVHRQAVGMAQEFQVRKGEKGWLLDPNN